MASARAKGSEQDGGAGAPPRKRRKLILGAGAFLVLGAGAGAAWFTGMLPGGTDGEAKHGEAKHGAATAEAGSLDLPDIVANLNTGTRRTSFIRLKARLQLTRKLDEGTLASGTPRLLDLFQTYLRDMRPEELRGSAGTYRLREELMARANLILTPARVTDVLFVEMLVQ